MAATSFSTPFRRGGVRNDISSILFLVQLTEIAIDYTNLISNLDNTASEIVAYQRDSTVQRKELAQKTKDFRKLDDATKLSEIKGLLKGTLLCPGLDLLC